MTYSKTLTKLIALSLITSSALHATNGDNLIATGTKARGMGGASIAIAHGAESGLSNPALITSINGTQIGFGGTLFMPKIETSIPFPANSPYTSSADTSMIPEVSLAHKINENWYIGVGMWGTAGMGVNYSQETFNPATGKMANFNMVTNLQLMQFGVPIAYKIAGLSLGITPILQYGNLDINYQAPTTTQGVFANTGGGIAQKFAFGYNLSAVYDLSTQGVRGLTLGLNYKSSIEMEYKGQLTTATKPFGVTLANGDILEQPSEVGVGFSYVLGSHTFAVDYKKVAWSKTKGYGDFGWEDQDVYALGYQFTQKDWAVRAGYNYGKTPVVEGNNPAFNFFNLLGFPATAEQHYTLGGTYNISKSFSVDLAYVYAPETSKTFDVSGLNMGVPSLTTTHSENSLAFQLTYNF